MATKPFFTGFEISMLITISVIMIGWIYVHVRNQSRAREHQKAQRDKWKVLRNSEQINGSMSNEDNVTYKN